MVAGSTECATVLLDIMDLIAIVMIVLALRMVVVATMEDVLVQIHALVSLIMVETGVNTPSVIMYLLHLDLLVMVMETAQMSISVFVSLVILEPIAKLPLVPTFIPLLLGCVAAMVFVKRRTDVNASLVSMEVIVKLLVVLESHQINQRCVQVMDRVLWIHAPVQRVIKEDIATLQLVLGSVLTHHSFVPVKDYVLRPISVHVIMDTLGLYVI